MNLDNAMDFEIKNYAPDVDAVRVIVGSHADSCIAITVERDGNEVYVNVVDHFDGSERRIVLGQQGMTEKL